MLALKLLPYLVKNVLKTCFPTVSKGKRIARLWNLKNYLMKKMKRGSIWFTNFVRRKAKRSFWCRNTSPQPQHLTYTVACAANILIFVSNQFQCPIKRYCYARKISRKVISTNYRFPLKSNRRVVFNNFLLSFMLWLYTKVTPLHITVHYLHTVSLYGIHN